MVAALFFLSGCLNEEFATQEIPNCDTTYFAREIRPIFTTYCTLSGCHDGSGSQPNYFQYSEIKTRIETTVNGVPLLMYRLNLPLSDPLHMPQNGILPLSEINKLQLWINNGYAGCD